MPALHLSENEKIAIVDSKYCQILVDNEKIQNINFRLVGAVCYIK